MVFQFLKFLVIWYDMLKSRLSKCYHFVIQSQVKWLLKSSQFLFLIWRTIEKSLWKPAILQCLEWRVYTVGKCVECIKWHELQMEEDTQGCDPSITSNYLFIDEEIAVNKS